MEPEIISEVLPIPVTPTMKETVRRLAYEAGLMRTQWVREAIELKAKLQQEQSAAA